MLLRHDRTLITHDFLIQSIWCILTHVPESVNTKYIQSSCMCMVFKNYFVTVVIGSVSHLMGLIIVHMRNETKRWTDNTVKTPSHMYITSSIKK